MNVREETMPAQKARIRHKHYRLNANKIARAKKALGAATETETIERALDLALVEHRRNQLVWASTERFLGSGVEIRDVYDKLSE
jgi:hypothetical protein